jgi:ceramide glucosyltransferase
MPSRVYPPVTLLKPVCGLDAELYENLRSFCEQDYPHYQIVFGVAEPTDPSVPIIRRLFREFPDLDLTLIIDSRVHGTNPKVSNLVNMYHQAKHDWLIIADSDMRVDPAYLSTIVAPFENSRVGAVTCLYVGLPVGGLASRLSAIFINEWFLPSVLVANAIQRIRYCFGATMAIRRELLERIGGFARLAPALADDYLLGKLISDLGYQVSLAPYLVENVVEEFSLKSLFLHELRWARTVCSVQPLGYALSFVTHAIPVSLLFLVVTPSFVLGAAVVGAVFALRLLMHRVVHRSLGLGLRESDRFWLVPLRDLFSFVVWSASFFGRDIRWRQHTFSVKADSQLAIKESQTL